MRPTAILVAAALLALAVPAAEAAEGKPGPRFDGDALPTPPAQNRPWTPPSTRLPADVVAAVGALFEHGMADPRDCEYREVEIVTDAGSVTRASGWVLPRGAGARRFVVAWNGLVYPAVSVGKPADLGADVAAGLARMSNATEWQLGMCSHEASLVTLGFVDLTAGPMLLRVGRADLAERVWGVWSRADEPSGGRGSEPYYALARHWAWAAFDRALNAHARGDDRLALVAFRALAAADERIEAECDRRGLARPDYWQTDPARPLHMTFLGQVGALVRDHELREARAHAAPPRDRVAALIDRLGEVSVEQSGWPGGVDVREDPAVQELLAAGEPAVDALVDAVERDDRMTRSYSSGRPWFYERHVISVAEVAASTARSILKFTPVAPEGQRGELTRAQEAARLRAYWAEQRSVRPEERWYRTLADDAKSPDQWLEAMQNLVRPTDEDYNPGGWVRETTRAPGATPVLAGESLRTKTSPSVSELAARRVEAAHRAAVAGPVVDIFAVDRAARLAVLLGAWDAAAAAPVAKAETARVLEFLRGDDVRGSDQARQLLGPEIARLAVVRARGGDPDALVDYARWIESIDARKLWYALSDTLAPLWTCRDDPAAVAAAEFLFEEPSSSLNPVVSLDADAGVFDTARLLETPLVELPAFRRQLLRVLSDDRRIGTLTVRKDSTVELEIPSVTQTSWQSADPALRDHAVGETFPLTAREYLAWLLSHREGAAPFELVWPAARKERAIADLRATLSR